MSNDTMKSIIVQVVSLSEFQINLIETKSNGVFIELQKLTKHGYINTLRGLVKNETDIGNLKEILELN